MEEQKPPQPIMQEFSEQDIDREPHKKSNKKIIIIILVILIIIIGVVLLWLNRDRLFSPKIELQESIPQIDERFIHDKDRDGILDEIEEQLGTSDFEFDTDGDGLSDKVEIEIWQTDPTNVDTDDDGFADGYEILKGFDPNGPGRL